MGRSAVPLEFAQAVRIAFRLGYTSPSSIVCSELEGFTQALVERGQIVRSQLANALAENRSLQSGSGASRSSSERRAAPASVGGRARAALPDASACLAEDLPALCPHLSYPLRLRRWLRSPNLLDRSLAEVKRHLAGVWVLQRRFTGTVGETPSAYRARDHSWTDSLPARLVRAALMGEPAYDSPSYVGYNRDGQDIGLDPPNGRRHGLVGPVCYWHVDDIQSSLQALLDAGAELVQPVQDIGGGWLRATSRTRTATRSGSGPP